MSLALSERFTFFKTNGGEKYYHKIDFPKGSKFLNLIPTGRRMDTY